MFRTPTIAVLLAAALLAATLAACGSSSDGTEGGASSSSAPPGVQVEDCGSGQNGVTEIRVAGMSCLAGRRISTVWSQAKSCEVPKQASRGSCRLGPLRCLSTVADRGVSVSCAMRGSTTSFLARR